MPTRRFSYSLRLRLILPFFLAVAFFTIDALFTTPADTAAILTEVYKETFDVIIEPLPKLKCIAIRADERTTKRIREIVGGLEVAHPNGDIRPVRVIPLIPSPPDLAIPDADN